MPAQILPALDYSRNQLYQQQLALDAQKANRDDQLAQLRIQHEQAMFQQQQQLMPLQKALLQAELQKHQQAGLNMKAEYDQQALQAPEMLRKMKANADQAESAAKITGLDAAEMPSRLTREATESALRQDETKARTAHATQSMTFDAAEEDRKAKLFAQEIANRKLSGLHLQGQVAQQGMELAAKQANLVSTIPLLPKGAAREPLLKYTQETLGASQQEVDSLRNAPEIGEAFKATVARHGPEMEAYYEVAQHKIKAGITWDTIQEKNEVTGEVKEKQVKRDSTMEGVMMMAKLKSAMDAMDKAKQDFIQAPPMGSNGLPDESKLVKDQVYKTPKGFFKWTGSTWTEAL